MNNIFGISDNSFNLILETFKNFPEVEEAVIFGSRAKGNFKKGSDIDIAIMGKNSSPELALKINGYLNETLSIPYFVDVVDYATITQLELKEHIDRVKTLLYKKEAE